VSLVDLGQISAAIRGALRKAYHWIVLLNWGWRMEGELRDRSWEPAWLPHLTRANEAEVCFIGDEDVEINDKGYLLICGYCQCTWRLGLLLAPSNIAMHVTNMLFGGSWTLFGIFQRKKDLSRVGRGLDRL